MPNDLVYRTLSRGMDWLERCGLRRVLVVGSPDPEQVRRLEAVDSDVREIEAAHATGLHRGVYAVHRRGQWEALTVLVGTEAPREESARYRHTDDGPRRHLGDARQLLDDEFEGGRPLLGSSPLAV